MRDFSKNKEEREKYVLKVFYMDNDTYTVVFADGRVFEGIKACDENIEKLNQLQEEQAKNGVDNIDYFKKRVTKSGIITAFVGAFMVVGSMVVASLPHMKSQDPIFITSSLGMIVILGVIPPFAKLVEDYKSVCELEKYKFRDLHRNELNSVFDYQNSLSGIDKEKKNKIIELDKPFSMIYMDYYNQDDLEMIISDIEKENSFQFIYKK